MSDTFDKVPQRMDWPGSDDDLQIIIDLGGDPSPFRSSKRRPIRDRLLDLVIPEPNSGCWIFLGAVHKISGYGVFNLRGGKTTRPHCVAYRIFIGPIPEGLDVCHKCDMRLCCNPTHLFTGTRLENMEDAKRKGRIARGERHSQAKLSPDEVLAIRAASGFHREIAERFGISREQVGVIRRRTQWTHI